MFLNTLANHAFNDSLIFLNFLKANLEFNVMNVSFTVAVYSK